MPLGPLLRLIPLAIAKTLSKLFGLATKTFFGRVPSQDDHKAGLIGLLSISWVALLPAVPFPELAEAMMPFLPDDEPLLRGTAVGLLVAGGPAVGLLIGRIANRSERGGRLLLTALQGYGYALVIGLLVVALVVVVPLTKASHLVRRLEMQHMAVMIAPEHFERAESRVAEVLCDHGYDVQVVAENRVMAAIFRALVWVEEKIFWRDMANRVSVIRGRTEHGPVVVELHPTDLAVRARRTDAICVFAILADSLDDRHVYFSWDEASQQLEDRIHEQRRAAADGRPPDDATIAELVDQLRRLALGPEEWSAIRRQLHRLEADALRARLGERAGTTAGDADAGL